jgi:hypothetical protein
MYIVNKGDFLYMIVNGSLNYDQTGRRRKDQTTKRKKNTFNGGYSWSAGNNYRRPTTQHKSLNTTICDTTISKESEIRKEVSSQYTVAVAYNKGAYQVIPKDGIKHIGR